MLVYTYGPIITKTAIDNSWAAQFPKSVFAHSENGYSDK